jgi:hypothetical protein
LDFFGIPWEQAAPHALTEFKPSDDYCVLASMSLLSGALIGRAFGDGLPPLLEGADSAFLFGGEPPTESQSVLQHMSRSASARIVPIEQKEIQCSIGGQFTDICGALSGLVVPARVRGTESVMLFASPAPNLQPIITSTEGCIFALADVEGTKCYLAPSADVIDILGPVEKGFFDIADYFFSAVPLVMYLRNAFREQMPSPPDSGACLIVDDPVLRPQYGFFDVRRISELAKEHNFSCNIAFIPWNWKRTRTSVADVFQHNLSRLSLSVHGCDHSGREFGSDDIQALNSRAKLALLRMEQHQQRSGLKFDPIMVFPQGAFSAISPGVLKHDGFIAAVNTEVSPVDESVRTQIQEIWRIAIRQYSDFAIYTRRYPFHGLHNFAFDLLLGKPCLIASHSSDFRDDSRKLVEFIDSLNSLSHTLSWRPLGDLIRRAYLQRAGDDAHPRIEMFANEIFVENSSASARHIVVKKLEHASGTINRVEADGRDVKFAPGPEYSVFELDLKANDSVSVRVHFNDIYGRSRTKRGLSGQVKQVVRRGLSEFRDESEAKAPWIYGLMQKARSWRTTPSRA